MGMEPGTEAESTLQRCDFCGAEVPSVRRVALDADYERLRTPHRERYACPACSESKERSRRGLPEPRRGA
jgi:uncharacterized protein with PIN domain